MNPTSVDKSVPFRSALQEYLKTASDVYVHHDPVDTEFEITAISREAGNRLSLFEKITGYPDFQIVTNILGKLERLVYFTGSRSSEDLREKLLASLSDNSCFSGTIGAGEFAPFRELTTTGDEVDLFKLPIVRHYKEDGSKLGQGRYITSGLLVSRDPANPGITNLSFSRIQPLGRNGFAFDVGSRGHTFSYVQQAMRKNFRMPITIVIGTSAVLYLLAASFTTCEYARSRHFGSIPLVRGNLNDLPVPADSEIVIEAELDPGVVVQEGPFAEYTGYMGFDSTGNVATVKCLMRRRKAIYYDIQPSNSPEHVNIFSLPRSMMIEGEIRRMIPMAGVMKLDWPHYASRFLALGYVKGGAPLIATNVGIGVVSFDPLWGKIVLISDDEIPLDIENFLAALAQEASGNFGRLTFFRDMFIISSDVASDSKMRSGKMLGIVSPVRYTREVSDEALILKTDRHRCSVSFRQDDGADVSVIIPSDISPWNLEQVGWVIATRVDPQRDVIIKNGKLLISATRKPPELPTIPEEIMERARKIVSMKK